MNAKVGGETQVPRITKLGHETALLAARNLQSEWDRVVNELRKLSNESGKGRNAASRPDVLRSSMMFEHRSSKSDFFLFFSREKNVCQKSSKTMGAHLELGPVTIIPDDVGRQKRPIRPQTSSTFQQGERERLSGATRQSSVAARISRGSDRALVRANCLRNEWGLLGPSSSCLARKHHESGPSVFTRQLWAGALFGATGLVQRGSIPFCTLPLGSCVCSTIVVSTANCAT